MNKRDLRDIGSLIEEKLEPIKKTLDEHTKILGGHSKILSEHSDKLDTLVLDVIHIQKQTDLIPDLHSLIKDTREDMAKLDERVEILESAA